MKRPYCDNCKLIWSKYASNQVKYCSQCNNPIVIKTFYPVLKIIGGIIIVLIGLFTLLSDDSSVIWIGGFLFGGSLIINGEKQFSDINKLDRDARKNIPNEKSILKRILTILKNNILYRYYKEKKEQNSIVITCGKCATKINVKKGQGIIKIKCPNCLGEYDVKS